MLQPIYVVNQQQPSSIPYIINANTLTPQILDGFNLHPEFQCIPYTDISMNTSDVSTINNDLWAILGDELPNETRIEEILLDLNNTQPFNMSQTFLNNNYLNQLQSDNPTGIFISPQNFIQTSNSLDKPATIDNAILTETILQENELITKKVKVHKNQSTTVTPVNYISNPDKRMSCNTIEMEIDCNYPKKPCLRQDLIQSKKIQIISQPRSKFRPRTQKESENTSHYIRCDDGAEQDYPAIHLLQRWAYESGVNIIEVALVDFEKQPHPYSINNKASRKSLEDQVLIIKQDEPNILYFRLTNEDFLAGFKTFMIEFIKSKQDERITKKEIRRRKLYQSMLRFTRIYRDEHGEFQRDVDSEEYSCIMTENYGDVAVEHTGPQYGPMCGQQMLFVVLKGRIVKEEISIVIFEQKNSWSQEIKEFTLNGNVIYFIMPPFPNPQITPVKANINIYFKNQKLHESKYLYMSTIDQGLTHIDSDMFVSMASTSHHHDMITDVYPLPLMSSTKSKNKSKKRLVSKSLSF